MKLFDEAVYKEVLTDEDIQNLYRITGNFHDCCIDFCEYHNDTLHLELYVPWGFSRGFNIEFVFAGNIAYSINLRFLAERGDPDWWRGTIMMKDGLVYLHEGSKNESTDEIKRATCWFQGQSLRYRVIPDNK